MFKVKRENEAPEMGRNSLRSPRVQRPESSFQGAMVPCPVTAGPFP